MSEFTAISLWQPWATHSGSEAMGDAQLALSGFARRQKPTRELATMKKKTKAETIEALTTALQALVSVKDPEAVHGAYDHAREVLREVGAMPTEPMPAPMTANRVIAIFSEMHKARFGINPRLDGVDVGKAKNIAAMFSGTEELHFRMVVREYFDDDTDPWMNGGDHNPPMMHALKWLDSSPRIMRYEQQAIQREQMEAEPVIATKRDPFEGIQT